MVAVLLTWDIIKTEYDHPLDYIQAVMAAIGLNQSSSIHSNQIIFFDISQKWKSYLDLDI